MNRFLNLFPLCILRLFSPDFHLFESYKRFMKLRPKAKFYLIDPRSIWNLWKVLHINVGLEISPNPPSSGFIGLALLLPYCSYIDIAEYIPSTRLNGRCHYYDEEVNLNFPLYFFNAHCRSCLPKRLHTFFDLC